MSVKVGVTGTYTLKAYEAQGIMGRSCLVLEDLWTGTSTPLTEGAEYTFAADVNDAAEPARFVLHATASLPHYYEATTCSGVNDGQATVVNTGSTPIDLTWMDEMGNVLLVQNQVLGLASSPGWLLAIMPLRLRALVAAPWSKRSPSMLLPHWPSLRCPVPQPALLLRTGLWT